MPLINFLLGFLFLQKTRYYMLILAYYKRGQFDDCVYFFNYFSFCLLLMVIRIPLMIGKIE